MKSTFYTVINRRLCKDLFLSFLLLFLSGAVFAQLRFPGNFKLVKGESGSSKDDDYTNGRYSFDRHQLFVENEYKYNDSTTTGFLSKWFGFPFHFTKDGLCWGTGINRGTYSYVVIAPNGENFELYSAYNDKGFAFYSKWLLSEIRRYKKEGKEISFPLRFN